MVAIHVVELPTLLAAARGALERGDPKAAAFAAHRLSGLAKSLDADEAAAAVPPLLEDAASSGSADRPLPGPSWPWRLDRSFNLVRDALLAIADEGQNGRTGLGVRRRLCKF